MDVAVLLLRIISIVCSGWWRTTGTCKFCTCSWSWLIQLRLSNWTLQLLKWRCSWLLLLLQWSIKWNNVLYWNWIHSLYGCWQRCCCRCSSWFFSCAGCSRRLLKILLALLLMNSGQYFVVVVEAKSVNTWYLSLALLLLRVVYCREEFLPMNETGERRVFYS